MRPLLFILLLIIGCIAIGYESRTSGPFAAYCAAAATVIVLLVVGWRDRWFTHLDLAWTNLQLYWIEYEIVKLIEDTRMSEARGENCEWLKVELLREKEERARLEDHAASLRWQLTPPYGVTADDEDASDTTPLFG